MAGCFQFSGRYFSDFSRLTHLKDRPFRSSDANKRINSAIPSFLVLRNAYFMNLHHVSLSKYNVHCTVPYKCKLTVSIESQYSTRSSILDTREYRVLWIEHRVSQIEYRVIVNQGSSIANWVLSIKDRISKDNELTHRTFMSRGTFLANSVSSCFSRILGSMNVKNEKCRGSGIVYE